MLSLRLLIIEPHHIFLRSASAYVLQFREIESVDVATDCHEALLITAQYVPDLILVDGNLLSSNPMVTKEIEKLKHANSTLDVLALYIFKDHYINRGRLLSSPVSGVIFKENFAQDLFDYLAAKKEQLTGGKKGSYEGV